MMTPKSAAIRSRPPIRTSPIPQAATLILRIDQPDGLTNHKGGWLGFGPDGYLYAALGDGGGGGDPLHTGQNNNDLLGNILRLDVHSDAFPGDATRNYAIPADNPFVGVDGADEVWAFGLRNPFRNGFDRGLGDLYIADVGQNKFEEIDIGQSGGNYGWNIFEGPDQFSMGTPTGGSAIAPIHFYGRDVGSTVIGGYVYRGQSEGLQGEYFFADEGNGHVFTLHNNGSSWVATDRTSQISVNAGAINNPTSFGQDALGNLYIVDIDGDVFRLTPNVASADVGDDLNGQGGNDMLFGGSGDDTLRGGPGDDQLYGGNGNDVLMGDAGRDMMAGGPGNDRFVLVPGSGAETIADFIAGANSGDRLDVAAFAGLKLTDILNRATQVGADTLIDFGNGDTVTLQNVDRNKLNIDDFIGVVNKTPTDFNGDGKIRPAVAQRHQPRRCDLADERHAGRSSTRRSAPSTAPAAGTSQDTGDFNGDGKTDLLLLNDTNHGVAIWQMNGTQVATAVRRSAPSTPPAAGTIEDTGDFNGDGKADLLLLNDTNHGVAIWQMNGTQVDSQPQVGTINAAAAGTSQDTGDFNGDGKTDLLLLNDTNHGVAVWQMNGTQVDLKRPGRHHRYAAGTSQDTGDFNGDGKTDLLLLNDTKHGVAVWQMNGTQVERQRRRSAPSMPPAGGASRTPATSTAMENQTCWFLNDTNHGVAVWQMNGTQVELNPQVGSINAAGGWHYDDLRDFNGDGKTDLLLENDTNHGVAVWLMDGTQVIASPQVGTVNAAADWHLIV